MEEEKASEASKFAELPEIDLEKYGPTWQEQLDAFEQNFNPE
jgi:hypothetical protein